MGCPSCHILGPLAGKWRDPRCEEQLEQLHDVFLASIGSARCWDINKKDFILLLQYTSLYVATFDLEHGGLASNKNTLRLASGIGSGGSSVVHACRVGQIYGSDVFQRLGPVEYPKLLVTCPELKSWQ